jgi:hypothetical protein
MRVYDAAFGSDFMCVRRLAIVTFTDPSIRPAVKSAEARMSMMYCAEGFESIVVRTSEADTMDGADVLM